MQKKQSLVTKKIEFLILGIFLSSLGCDKKTGLEQATLASNPNVKLESLGKCSSGEFSVQDKIYEYSCNCGDLSASGWFLQADGCYHRQKPSSSASCTKGSFQNNGGQTISYACGCADVQSGDWVLQRDGCYHRLGALPDTSSPSPAPVPSPSPGPVSPPENVPAGSTTIAQAAQYPDGAFFKAVRWGGVFDPRVTGVMQYQPTLDALADPHATKATGQGQCLTESKKFVEWSFNNNNRNANEALTSLRIAPGDRLGYKIILPPGASKAYAMTQAGFWGNVWTQSTARNEIPVDFEARSYGGFNPMLADKNYNLGEKVSVPVDSYLENETYGVFWFHHRGEGDVRMVGVMYFVVSIEIKNIAVYNAWLEKTTGIDCP